MKKVVLTLVLLLTFSFCLAGCSGENYWEVASANCEQVFTSENFDNTLNISFKSELQTIMNASYGTSYSELKNVLAPLFESAVYYSYMHYKDFLLVPQHKTSKFKTEVDKVNENIKDFEKSLEVFLDAKSDYESHITFTSESEATSDKEQARLLLFKREYITIIESAYNLSESLFNARKAGYYNYSDYTSDEPLVDERADCALAVNASSLQITKVAIKITRAYNAKQMASEYKNYWTASQDFHNNVVKKFENKTLIISSDVKNKLNIWQGVYEIFEIECKAINQIMKEIDVWKLAKCGNNPFNYALLTKNEQDEYKATYFLNFYQNITTLKQYTKAMFN